MQRIGRGNHVADGVMVSGGAYRVQIIYVPIYGQRNADDHVGFIGKQLCVFCGDVMEVEAVAYRTAELQCPGTKIVFT